MFERAKGSDFKELVGRETIWILDGRSPVALTIAHGGERPAGVDIGKVIGFSELGVEKIVGGSVTGFGRWFG